MGFFLAALLIGLALAAIFWFALVGGLALSALAVLLFLLLASPVLIPFGIGFVRGARKAWRDRG